MLDAPKGDGAAAVRDRAILALMGRHGLRVPEVAGLIVDAVGLDAGTVRVTGKGRKTRTVYLTEASAAALCQWLDIRASVADPDESALFVSLDRVHRGGGRTPLSALALTSAEKEPFPDKVGDNFASLHTAKMTGSFSPLYISGDP